MSAVSAHLNAVCCCCFIVYYSLPVSATRTMEGATASEPAAEGFAEKASQTAGRVFEDFVKTSLPRLGM
jgi:phosphate/sulfate permease